MGREQKLFISLGMMMMMKMSTVEEEEPTQTAERPVYESSAADDYEYHECEEEKDHLPISQLFHLLKQRREREHDQYEQQLLVLLQSSSMPMASETQEYPRKAARCKRKMRPSDNNKHSISKDHTVKALPLPLPLPAAEEGTAGANSSVVERAKEVQANLPAQSPSFFKIMIPSVVCHCFCMSLPKEFCQLHLPDHDTTVILVDENKREYKIKFLVQRRILSGGWRKFSRQHDLLVGDALVFHLISPSKFKVYIVRKNGLGEVDAALGLLRLETSANQTCTKHAGENKAETSPLKMNQYEVHRCSLSYPSAEENQSENDSLGVGSCEVVEGIKSSSEVDAEFTQLRDAIKASKLSTTPADFMALENTLSGFDLLGMDFGLLRNRVHRLLGLAFESTTEVRSKRYKEAELERSYVEQEARFLEVQLSEKRQQMHRLDAEIEALKVNAIGRSYQLMSEAAANAPW